MEYTLTQEMVKEYERHLWLAERWDDSEISS